MTETGFTQEVKSRCKLPENRKCENRSICRLSVISLSIVMHKEYFLFGVGLPQDAAMLVHPLTVKSRKRLAGDV